MRYYSIDASLINNTSSTDVNSGPSSPATPGPPGASLSKPLSKKEENAAKRKEQIAQYNAIVSAESFGRYRGRDALVMRLVNEYVLVAFHYCN